MTKNNILIKSTKFFVVLAILVGIVLFFQTTVDDSYICFRYGYNLIHHGIWNWNADNERIEAYTSFTYMILSVFPPLLNIQPQIFFKIFTFIFFLLILRRIYTLVDNKKYAWFIIFFVVANWHTHVHIYAGLETIFWFYLLIETFSILYKEDFSNKQQSKLWLLALLFPLTRPEGAVFSMFIFVYVFFKNNRKIYFPTLILFALIGGIYFILRYKYFGLLLPLSFYHKSIGNNMGFLGILFNTYTAWQYLFLLIFLLFQVKKQNKLAFYFILTVLFVYYAFYGTSALLMNYANRFAFQLFYPAIIFALIMLAQKASEKINKKVHIVMLVFIALIVYKGFTDKTPLQFGTIKENMLFTAYMHKTHFNTGNQIAALKNNKIKVLMGDAGVLPYLANTKCYDPYGLADVYLSTKHIDRAYFDKMDADLLILSGFFNEETIHKDITNVGKIYQYISEPNSNYTYLYKFTTAQNNKYAMFFYVKNNSKYKIEIIEALDKAKIHHDNFKITPKDFLTFQYLNNYKVND